MPPSSTCAQQSPRVRYRAERNRRVRMASSDAALPRRLDGTPQDHPTVGVESDCQRVLNLQLVKLNVSCSSPVRLGGLELTTSLAFPALTRLPSAPSCGNQGTWRSSIVHCCGRTAIPAGYSEFRHLRSIPKRAQGLGILSLCSPRSTPCPRRIEGTHYGFAWWRPSCFQALLRCDGPEQRRAGHLRFLAFWKRPVSSPRMGTYRLVVSATRWDVCPCADRSPMPRSRPQRGQHPAHHPLDVPAGKFGPPECGSRTTRRRPAACSRSTERQRLSHYKIPPLLQQSGLFVSGQILRNEWCRRGLVNPPFPKILNPRLWKSDFRQTSARRCSRRCAGRFRGVAPWSSPRRSLRAHGLAQSGLARCSHGSA